MSLDVLATRSRPSRATRLGAIGVAVGLLFLLTSAAPLGPRATAASRYSKTVRTIRPGLSLIKVTDSVGPNRIKVLRVDPSTKLTIETVLSNESLPGRETTSSMASRKGAIAAINGNPANSWGRPLGFFAGDGKLQTSPIAEGAGAFALSQDESSAYFGYPRLHVDAQNLATGLTWSVDDWNEEYPSPGGIAGYTKSGGDVVRPPKDACAIRLVPATKLAWNAGKLGVARTYGVAKARCSARRLSPRKGIVLASALGTHGAKVLAAARVGQSVRLGWSLGWAGVMDVIGGSPVLMRAGAVTVAPCSAYVCRRHPRTGVGVTAAGDVLLVTVDGRQTNSVGLDIVEFARLFKWLGAESALNLDGGGSSTMVLRGKVVNSPSDGRERAVSSALLVLPQRDHDEPRPTGP